MVIGGSDPVTADAPAFDVHHQTPEAAAKQFGYNCDYVGVLATKNPRVALLVVNHEYTDEPIMHPAGSNDEDTIKRIAMASHGMSVVEIMRGGTPGSWRRRQPKASPKNRRIHVGTEFEMVGPAAGDARLRTSADATGTRVLGTLNNCAGGTTPWGTVLSGEENFNGYFDKSGAIDPAQAESYARYGISGGGRGWASVDPRFDLTTEPNEPNRFGWVVELDPSDPTSTPRKHTMLGRFKHEGANVALAPSGQAVAYMGDDERGDYLYKFVSRDRFDGSGTKAAKRHNMTLLTHGTLYVAKLTGDGTEDGEFDGTGEWIPLTSDTTPHVEGMSVNDILINTRLAADKVGPTKMDRCEDVEPNPVNGRIYVACTNNSDRGSRFPVDEANPLATSMVRSDLGAPLKSASGNRNGYVLEMVPNGDDHAATGFTWNLMLVCGDPEAPETYFAGYDKSEGQPDLVPGQRRLRRQRQPVDLHRRQRARLQRRHLPGAGRRPEPWRGQAVPHRAARRRDLRTADHRRRPDAVLRRPAPGRGRRGDVREPGVHLAAHRRLPASLGLHRVPRPLTVTRLRGPNRSR